MPLLRTLRQDIWLTWTLAIRSCESRYRGSALGALWTILSPLVMLGIYLVVFSGVLQVRFAGGTTTDFAIFAFAGLVPFSMVSESLATSVSVVIHNTALIKKTPVRPHVFPLSVTLASFLTQLPGVILLILAAALLNRLSWTALALPVLLLPQLLFAAGLCLAVAALGVYLRDLVQVVGLLITAWFIATPIFYPADAVPAHLRWAFALNPLAWLITSYRQVLLQGELPDFRSVPVAVLIGLFSFAIGLWVFQRLRPGFADVL